MKTIKQVADDLKVSKQAIRNVIEKLGLQGSLQKNANRFLINEKQENLIKSEFYNKNENKSAKESTIYNEKQNAFYENIIKEQQEQIKHLQKLLENQQVLTLQANQKIEFLENVQEPKKSFFSKLFK